MYFNEDLNGGNDNEYKDEWTDSRDIKEVKFVSLCHLLDMWVRKGITFLTDLGNRVSA